MTTKARTHHVNCLLRRIEREQVRYEVHPVPERNGWQVITFDQKGDPLTSTIIDDLSIGGVADFFETAVYDEHGKIQSVTGWQTIDEVIDTIRGSI